MAERDEYLDIRVRMLRRDEAQFRTALGNFPQFKIVDEEEGRVDVKPSTLRVTDKNGDMPPKYIDLPWDKELLLLEELVGEVSAAYERKDLIALAGYKRMNYLTLVPEDGFAPAVIEAFQNSVDIYKEQPVRPGHYTGSGQFRYGKIPGSVNPMDVRLVIGYYSLDGKVTDKSDMGRREGRSSSAVYLAYAANNRVFQLVRQVVKKYS